VLSFVLYKYISLNSNVKKGGKKMEREEIAKIVKDIVVEKLGVDANEVTENASFIDDLGADSLDTVELVMDFEGKFGLEIPDEDAEKIRTVGDAINYIENNISKK